MSTALKLFLAEQLWFQLLSDSEQAHVRDTAYARQVLAGSYICRAGEQADHWLGVVSGLVKASIMTVDGKTTTYTGVAAGGWLGEGSVLNGTIRRFDIVALRDSYIAFVPRTTFMVLHDKNIQFCHFLIRQLNRRLAQQMALIEIDRLVTPEVRVARFLLMMADSQSGKASEPTLEISQAEIAHLCGLSRQFTNKVLAKLTTQGLVEHRYGRLKILNKDGLLRFDPHSLPDSKQ